MNDAVQLRQQRNLDVTTTPTELSEGLQSIAGVKKFIQQVKGDTLLKKFVEAATADDDMFGGLWYLERQITALELIARTFYRLPFQDD
jgi:hypothetical protein